MAGVRLDRVSKRFGRGDGVAAVDRLSLEVVDGELMVLVGPSGCGKTTTLRMVAGLEAPSGGRIFIGDADVTRMAAKDRDVAMVFQNYALYPHKTVRENIAFGLRMRQHPRRQINERVDEVAATLGLTPLLARKPGALSGGERQRVALGRAIARRPRAYLLDEPLSNLDATLRANLRTEIKALHRRLGATMIHVTHDQEEAMSLGDRIAVMRDGVVQQCGKPMEVYNEPVNRFVAGFLGTPSMNFFSATIVGDGRRVQLEGGLGEFPLPRDAPLSLREPAAPSVVLGIRPEHLRLAPPGSEEPASSQAASLEAVVDVVEPLGNSVQVRLVTSSGTAFTARVAPTTPPVAGKRVRALFDAERVLFFQSGAGGERLV